MFKLNQAKSIADSKNQPPCAVHPYTNNCDICNQLFLDIKKIIKEHGYPNPIILKKRTQMLNVVLSGLWYNDIYFSHGAISSMIAMSLYFYEH